MTDEAPTAAEVEALIADATDVIAVLQTLGYDRYAARIEALAAALAAQAQRIAAWEQVWDGVRIHVPDLRENNKPLAVAASYELLWMRAEKAEAALRQAERTGYINGLTYAGNLKSRVPRGNQGSDVLNDIRQQIDAAIAAAPAAAPGEG